MSAVHLQQTTSDHDGEAGQCNDVQSRVGDGTLQITGYENGRDGQRSDWQIQEHRSKDVKAHGFEHDGTKGTNDARTGTCGRR